MEKEKKVKRCRFSWPTLSDDELEYICLVDGCEDDKIKKITEDVCETCEKFNSKYIEYPIEVSKINNRFEEEPFSLYECGTLVKIRPCAKEYNNKTYLGIMLGEMPMGANFSYNPKSKELSIIPNNNPAIFVPKLKKVIYGCESWWGVIKDESQIKDILDKDIDDIWYVKLLKEGIVQEDKVNE